VAVKIRMKVMGRKNLRFYRVCAMDIRRNRDAKPIEELGTYDPHVKNKAERVKLNLERIDYWISVGALPSEKVAALIKKVRLNRFGSAKPPAPVTAPKPLPVAESAPATEEAAAPAEASS